MPTIHHDRRLMGDEHGVALIMALFMILAMSVLGASLMFMAQSETWSTANYKLAAQARYGAESGVQKAANFLLNCPPAPAACTGNYDPNLYLEPGENPLDPLSGYVLTGAEVTATGNGQPVVLSSDPAVTANYPVAAVQTAFSAATQGTLALDGNPVTYKTSARLLSMRQYPETLASNAPRTIQTWEITSVGTIAAGLRSSQVEVSAVIERQLVPTYRYAAFAEHNGCAALSFSGGATTDSYDSRYLVGGLPVLGQYGGNVGTNGNLTEAGNNTTVNGSLSTPRSGVGNCTANNVTAQTINGGASVTNGLVELAQPIDYTTPTLAGPPKLGTTQNFASGCVTLPSGSNGACTTVSGDPRLAPAAGQTTVFLGDVRIGTHETLRLASGTYVVNSISMSSHAELMVEPGATVTIQVAGLNLSGGQAAIDFTGGALVNDSYDPSKLQITYGGTGVVKLTGGADTSALVYAPNADTTFTSSGGNFYGAIITKYLRATGGVNIHYDRNLQNTALTAGEPMMNSFTWKSF